MEEKKLPKTDVQVRPIRTYPDDIAQIVGEQKESAISISVKQAEKKQKEEDLEKKNNPEIVRKAGKPISKSALAFMSIFFVVGGLVVLGYFWWQSRPADDERIIIDTLLIADGEVKKELDNISKTDFENFVRAQKNIPREAGAVTHLKFSKKTLSTEHTASAKDVLKVLESKTPPALVRSMSGDNMFGLIQVQGESIPFWIIEVDSFENAFDGILDWEDFIQEDLVPVFSNSTQAIDPVFTDVISRNKDIRVLRNNAGEELLVHTFLDKNTLLITEKEIAFKELLPLFISSKQIR